MPKFFLTSGFKAIGPKRFDLKKRFSNSSKGCICEVDLEYPEELHELQNYYPLVSHKIKIKREMLPEHQLRIVDSYNISIGNVQNLVPKIFYKEKDVIHYGNLQLYFRLGLKLKKIISVLEFNQSQWLKSHIEFITQKRTQAEKKVMAKMEKRCAN